MDRFFASPLNKANSTLLECLFGNTSVSITVHDIIAEPSATSESFIVYGTRLENGITRGVILQVDFYGLHQRECNDSDYEIWVPTDLSHRNCYMGVTVGVTRRNRTAECHNPMTYEPVSVLQTCPCAQEDYEWCVTSLLK